MWILRITIIVGMFVITSCSPPSGQLSENQDDLVKQTIGYLRLHGFFEKFKTLSDDQLFDTLHKQRIADYSQMFERFYDPGMKLETYQILMLDRDRTVYGDAEFDVGKDNNQYVSIIKAFSTASGGLFNPQDITEKWESEKGPVYVSFNESGRKIIFEPEYLDDWLSEKVFEVIDMQMRKNGKERFYMFLGEDGMGLGQYFLYIRMTEPQKEKLQKTFGWKFSE